MKKFRLLDEDRLHIKDLMKEQGKIQSDLSSFLGYKRPNSISDILNGKNYITESQLKKLYEFLDEDESVNYLLDYGKRLNPTKSSEQLWGEIFDTITIRLKESYLPLPAEKKGDVIGELEKLTNYYSQENDE